MELEKESVVKAYVLDNGKVVATPSSRVERIQTGLPATRGEAEEDRWNAFYLGKDIVEPPFNLEYLAKFMDLNTTHSACIRAKVLDVIKEWEIVPTFEEATGKEANVEEKDRLEYFFDNCNDEMSFLEMMRMVWTDYEALGNGDIEVVRNSEGEVKALYHLPAHTMRVGKDRQTFYQIRGMKKVMFRRFGVDLNIAQKARNRIMKFLSSTVGGKLSEATANQTAPQLQDSEVIQLRDYSTRSSYYGVPSFIPAVPAIYGDKKAKDFVLSFFENNAVPQYAIVIQGADLTDDVKKQIQEYFQHHIRGADKGHATLVLGINKRDVEIKFEKLALDVKDASFRMFRQDNRDEIIQAHGVPPFKVGVIETGNIGTGTGESQVENYKNSVIAPRQRMLEHRLYQFTTQAFGITDWMIKFGELDVSDIKLDTEISTSLVSAGIISPNEARQRIGYDALENGGDEPYIIVGNQIILMSQLEEAAETGFASGERMLDVVGALEQLRNAIGVREKPKKVDALEQALQKK